jgi:dihydropteroate synthase
VRVHDVRASVDALKVVEAWSGGQERSDRGISSG